MTIEKLRLNALSLSEAKVMALHIERLRALIRRAMEHGVNGSDHYDALKAGDLGREMRTALSPERDDDGDPQP